MKFGGREAGSPQEKQAQLYFKSLLEKFCTSVSIHEFDVPVKAKFESLKIFCIIHIISLLFFRFSPAAAFVLSLLNAVFYLGHFVTYRHWLDFLYPKKKSCNVIGVIEPKQKTVSTVIVSGHMDSTKEFIWWYRLKHPGLVLTVLSGFVIGLFPFFSLAVLIFNSDSIISESGWWLFTLATPMLILLFSIHGGTVIQGAQDNLSGIAIAYAVGKHFAGNKPEKTRIKVISFGSEECGLRGAEAYAKQYNQELRDEHAICINLDGVKDADKLHLFTAETNPMVKYPAWLVRKMEDAFQSCGVRYFKKALPIGATDGAAMQRCGIPSVTIIGQSTEKLDPTYHTRLDVPACVDEKALDDVMKVVVQFIEGIDKQ